jgi:HEPN domain-containing protein
MKEVIKALVENEEQGIHFEGSDKELDLLRKQLTSKTIYQGNRTSIENAIALYTRGSYTDAARVFFPSIEAVANQMLSIAGEKPNDYKTLGGLAPKLKKLEELKLIPADLSKAIDIAYSRNKVLHGEFEPLEQEYAYPLCVAGIIYLRRILDEFEKVKAKVGND